MLIRGTSHIKIELVAPSLHLRALASLRSAASKLHVHSAESKRLKGHEEEEEEEDCKR